jgi:hypothetical protein
MSETTPAPIRGLTISDLKVIGKGAALAAFTFVYGHVTIHDAMLLRSGDKVWINLPGRERRDREGAVMIGANGKKLYSPVCSWTSREGSERIQAALLDIIGRHYPQALGGGS